MHTQHTHGCICNSAVLEDYIRNRHHQLPLAGGKKQLFILGIFTMIIHRCCFVGLFQKSYLNKKILTLRT